MAECDALEPVAVATIVVVGALLLGEAELVDGPDLLFFFFVGGRRFSFRKKKTSSRRKEREKNSLSPRTSFSSSGVRSWALCVSILYSPLPATTEPRRG